MPLFKVYIVREVRLGIIDSAWKMKADALRKAETLSIHKGPIDERYVPEWVVQEVEVE